MDRIWIRGGLIVRTIRTVGELREFLSDLDDGMLVVGMENEAPLFFVCDYEDVPGEDRPPPALVIEC
jgi:hypothetical protein